MKNVWLPEIIYNRIPCFYIGVGILFGFMLGKIGLLGGLGLICFGIFRKGQRF